MYRTISSREEWWWIGLASSAEELRLARLVIPQRVSSYAYDCGASLAAAFEPFSFQSVTAGILQEDANPRFKQFWHDLHVLSDLDTDP